MYLEIARTFLGEIGSDKKKERERRSTSSLWKTKQSTEGHARYTDSDDEEG